MEDVGTESEESWWNSVLAVFEDNFDSSDQSRIEIRCLDSTSSSSTSMMEMAMIRQRIW